MKQKRTILFLTRLYHPHIGGVEKHVGIVTSLLIKKGYRVVIVTEQFDKSLPENEIVGDATVFRMPIRTDGFKKKFLIWKWVIKRPSVFLQSDIIHIHDVFFWILPVLPLLFLKKIYMTFHGYEGYPVKMRWKSQRKVAEWVADGSICVGEFMKKWYSANPDHIIYGGVEAQSVKKQANSQSAVFFGRLDSQTGIGQYLKAYRKIRKKFPRFKLRVVGGGELESLIPKDVEVVPFTTDVTQHIAESRFIFVSRYLSMLEALVQKKEVVAVYDNPVKRDYLNMSPFSRFVSVAKDEDQIADVVLRSLENPKLNKKKVDDGASWANNQTWEKVVGTYLRLWKEK